MISFANGSVFKFGDSWHASDESVAESACGSITILIKEIKECS